jgi:hypothetical protein
VAKLNARHDWLGFFPVTVLDHDSSTQQAAFPVTARENGASSAPDYCWEFSPDCSRVNSSILVISKAISRILMPFSDGTLVAKREEAKELPDLLRA